jgi:serpin B
MLVPQTRLVLTNAIYFLGTWRFPFDEERTKEEDFFAPSGTVKVPLMRDTKRHRYADAGGHHVLQLPYKGKDLAMVLLVPKKKDGLGALEEALSAEALAGWIDATAIREVRVLLPRFKVTWRAMMKKVLSGMGMARAFDPEKADFTGMNGGTEPLWIGEVVHKAFVEVDEEGTEAAAATGVGMVGTALPPEPPPEVRCDRPFVFLIRDTRSGAILFLGRLVKPAE